MSFFSRDTFERSISKSREKERRSTISHEQSSDSEAEQAKKGRLLERHHQDVEIPKHPSNEESEVTKIARQEPLGYCRDKLIIKPKKIPYDQKQKKISQGITKQGSDYPTMEDICSDWESYDETEQMTQQPETKAYHESTKPILQQHQTSKESSPQLHQQQQQYQQTAQYNQQVQHYQTPQNHYQIKQHQLSKTSNLMRFQNKSIEKQQLKKKSNVYLKPDK